MGSGPFVSTSMMPCSDATSIPRGKSKSSTVSAAVGAGAAGSNAADGAAAVFSTDGAGSLSLSPENIGTMSQVVMKNAMPPAATDRSKSVPVPPFFAGASCAGTLATADPGAELGVPSLAPLRRASALSGTLAPLALGSEAGDFGAFGVSRRLAAGMDGDVSGSPISL